MHAEIVSTHSSLKSENWKWKTDDGKLRKFHSGCKDEIIRFHYSLSDGRRTDVGRPSDGRPTVVRSLSDRRPAAVRRPSNGRPKNIRQKKFRRTFFRRKMFPEKLPFLLSGVRTPLKKIKKKRRGCHFSKNYGKRPRIIYDWVWLWNNSWDVCHNSSKSGVLSFSIFVSIVLG